jgi:predicted GTPase
MGRVRVVILGAAGRDFHDFNLVCRDDPALEVVAFTAQQIPGIEGRRYPPELAGPLYPTGIPIVEEAQLEALCRRERVDRVVLAYSDLAHAQVMHLASRALATGADFELLGPERTMLRARVPVVAVSAVRTGCGKSQTARWLARRLVGRGLRAVALRHPMPYGDLVRQRVQRFASRADIDDACCTAEEREEYEPYVDAGGVVFAGVDYQAILERAEREADVLLWDGGNNDFPFLRPDLHVVLVDALRPGQLDTHHPGETVARMADVILVNKVDAAAGVDVQRAVEAARALGPTLTHGGMPYGAGYVAAAAAGPAEIVDPRASAPPEIQDLYARHPHLGSVLPAVGYSASQLQALRETIERSEAEVVVSGTPLDLDALLHLARPVVRARYGFQEVEEPGLGALVDDFLAARGLG